MPLPRKPYRDWNTGDLSQLIQEPKAEESARLDFKKDCNLLHKEKRAKDKARMDILKDVSAMANGIGGALLIGVEEKGGPDTPPIAEKIPGIPKSKVEHLKSAIASLVDTHLQVRPGPLRFIRIPVDDKGKRVVLVVEIPQNTYSLSMATYDDLGQFWVRRDTNNRLMATYEIQYDFERMAKIRESAKDELQNICISFLRTSSAQKAPLAWFAAVPIQRFRDHVPVDLERLQKVIFRSSYHRRFPHRRRPGAASPFGSYESLRPSLHGVAIREPTNTGRIFEIRRDGTIIFGAVDKPYRADERNRIRLECIYEAWCSGLYLLKDVQDEFGVSRVAVVQAGLCCPGNTALIIPRWNDEPAIKNTEVPLDEVLLDENWSPETVFLEWATQFSNYLDKTQPIICPPWVAISSLLACPTGPSDPA